LISPVFEKQLWAYMAMIAREINVEPLIINGVEDHVHMLVSIPSTITIAEVMKKIKAVSSLWISRTFKGFEDFEWQAGYGAFSISHYDLNKTIRYIKNQKEHHRKNSFEKEYIQLLKENQIEYDEKYLFG
jgi:REP element-mobilizing transposase RayT